MSKWFFGRNRWTANNKCDGILEDRFIECARCTGEDLVHSTTTTLSGQLLHRSSVVHTTLECSTCESTLNQNGFKLQMAQIIDGRMHVWLWEWKKEKSVALHSHHQHTHTHWFVVWVICCQDDGNTIGHNCWPFFFFLECLTFDFVTSIDDDSNGFRLIVVPERRLSDIPLESERSLKCTAWMKTISMNSNQCSISDYQISFLSMLRSNWTILRLTLRCVFIWSVGFLNRSRKWYF